jgi:hypothetical protein
MALMRQWMHQIMLSPYLNNTMQNFALNVIHPADVDLFGSTGEMSAAAYNTIDMNKEAEKYLDKVKLKLNRVMLQSYKILQSLNIYLFQL